jgi:hypothetical protein
VYCLFILLPYVPVLSMLLPPHPHMEHEFQEGVAAYCPQHTVSTQSRSTEGMNDEDGALICLTSCCDRRLERVVGVVDTAETKTQPCPWIFMSNLAPDSQAQVLRARETAVQERARQARGSSAAHPHGLPGSTMRFRNSTLAQPLS